MRVGLGTIVLLAVCAVAVFPPAAALAADQPPDDPECPTRAADGQSADPGTQPRIVELYPNPTIPGNDGEYFVLETPPNTSVDNWTVTDGHTTAALPNATVSGRTAVSMSPERTRALTDAPVLELEGHLRLAADGDRIEVRADGEPIDAVAYDRAPLAERWYRAGGDYPTGASGDWWPRDATCLPVSTGDATTADAFVQPDSPEVPVETLRAADDRILLAGYTFTSEAVAEELVAATDRGVEVSVLLEAGPVGGTPDATETRLDDLERAGVDVRVLGGEGARYRYHHPKYAVADDTLLVMTENWSPSGVGGASSRGWGVRLEDPALAADLAAVFEADFEGWDTRSWSAHRTEATFVEDEPSTGAFPREHGPESVSVDGVELLLAPDNAESRLGELIEGADERVLIKQPRIGDEVSLLEAAVDAAHRGVEVRILLDSTWYVEDDNEALADDLETAAANDDLPLEVALVDSGDRFEKIHAKGLVVDGETAVVGSANWNNNSLQNNREVLLVLHGEEAAAYYAAVFEDDWSGETWLVPVELLGIVAVALLGVGYAGRKRIRFELSSRAGSHSRAPRRDRPPPSSRPMRR
ncbi:phospholipase D-like domain-containing protein [Natrononativus amylolyticus]|uniref:phospholipase D-like domain-containing protein n=1 Tax=Natrononativus amylolyticus TaxID=2963434 RepID=UPI0020CBDB9B|nr:phospholipase D-like domain-containing protein [Natrononativus amylolyticus]